MQDIIKRTLTALILTGVVTGLSIADEKTDGEGGQGSLFEIARLQYSGGGDWYNDPSIIPNLCREINKRADTAFPMASEKEAVVTVSDARLFQYPFLFMTGHGNVSFTDSEISRLRSYFEAGGFLYADDDYGMDESFRHELEKIFPEVSLVELPHDFPLYRIPFRFPGGLPKIHEHDGKPPQGFGIFLRGRLVVYYTYETNISDGWADQRVHGDPPQKREEALKMGLNIVFYALTH